MWRNNSAGIFSAAAFGALALTACGVIGSDAGNDQAVPGANELVATDATADASGTLPAASTPPSSLESAAIVEVVTVDAVEGAQGAASTVASSAVGAVSTSTTAVAATSVSTTVAPTSSSQASTTVASAPSTSDPPSTSTAPPSTAATTAAPTTTQPPATTTSPPAASGLTYKGLLAAGDDSITAFDNARRTVKGLLVNRGIAAGNLVELSRQSSEQVNGVRPTSVGDIEQAMAGLNLGTGDACILFLTSHGNQQAWFVRGAAGLTPDRLDQILDNSCGTRPTIALISACYSGIFMGPLAAPNRVVLTAASPTNTSFGCSPEATYTYWDGCLIAELPAATTWEDLYRRVTGCIEGKEASAGVTPSRPQAHFGAEVAGLAIPGG